MEPRRAEITAPPDATMWRRRLTRRWGGVPLSTRMALLVGLLVGLVTAVALILSSLRETELETAALARRLDHAAYALAEALAPELESRDRDALARRAAPAMRLAEIASVSVRAPDGELLLELKPTAGAARAEGLTGAAPLHTESGGGELQLGSVSVTGRAPDPWSDLAERAPTMAVLASAAALIAAALTDALANRAQIQPMRELEIAMANGRRAQPPASRDVVDCGDFRRLYDRYNLVVDTLEATAVELDGRLAELHRANAATSRFLAVISHELRTPLNGVLGMAQLLNATSLQERQQDIVATILASGGALSAVIDDVLDASKIEAGLLELNYDLFDLHETARRAVEENADMAALKGLRLESAVDLPPETRFVGDGRRVRQILGKLLHNAVKFTDAGEVRLWVGPGDPFGVRVEVADTGPGVPEDRRELIFERFRQGDDSDTRRHGGAGLGLAISKEVIELMGGRIAVEAVETGGARFVVDLPLEHIRAAPEKPQAPLDPAQPRVARAV